MRFLKIILVYVPNVMLYLFGSFVLLADFKSLKTESISTTTYVLPVLLATSSVCFSWVKLIDVSNENYHKILKSGESLFYAGILFILGTIMKYLYLHVSAVPIIAEYTIFRYPVKLILLITFLIMFTYGFYVAFRAIHVLNKVIYNQRSDSVKKSIESVFFSRSESVL